MHCPLCKSRFNSTIQPKHDRRHYLLCQNCGLISVPPEFHVSPAAEIHRYEEHNNRLDDEGYLNFLLRLVNPALPFINSSHSGLDFGCGPVKGIAHLLEKQNISCDSYDPFFFPELPNKSYDFIFASECFEHFFSPKNEIKKLLEMLTPNGHLFVMTEIFHSLERFSTWYYKRDATHVSFFSMKTWEYICETYSLTMLYSDQKRIFLLQKNSVVNT